MKQEQGLTNGIASNSEASAQQSYYLEKIFANYSSDK
jgi:hypothetical protein